MCLSCITCLAVTFCINLRQYTAPVSIVKTMVNREKLFLEPYFDFDSILPADYFEVLISSTENNQWVLFYIDDQEAETEYGPYDMKEVLERIVLAPFFIDEIVFVYHLVEHNNETLNALGVDLLKHLANR